MQGPEGAQGQEPGASLPPPAAKEAGLAASQEPLRSTLRSSMEQLANALRPIDSDQSDSWQQLAQQLDSDAPTEQEPAQVPASQAPYVVRAPPASVESLPPKPPQWIASASASADSATRGPLRFTR